MKTYTVDSKATYWLFVIGMPCFFLGFASLWLWTTMHGPSYGQGVIWFAAIWLLLVAWGTYGYVTMPHSIEVTDNGTIRFLGTFRTSTVKPTDVLKIRTRPGPLIEVRYVGGKIYLLNQFTGFHQFLTELKQVNPNVMVRGL